MNATEQEINVEEISVALVAIPADEVPDGIDVDRIAEDVLEAAFVKAHERLEEVEGFKRYGDIGPGEVDALTLLSRLLVRSVLANGPMEAR